jgi:pilus assembly protein Flp/PilA
MRARVISWVAGLRKEEGQTAVEYGVLLALILAVSVGVITALGVNVFDAFTLINNAIS